MTAEGALKEELRVDRRTEFTTPFTVIVPREAPVEWGLVDGGAGLLDFVVFADGAGVMRWPLPPSRFLSCGNSDDAGFSDGTLDVTRLVPVLYVGWGAFNDPMTQATLVMRFTGHSPRFIAAPPAGTVGQPISLDHGLFFEDGGLVLNVSTVVVLRVESPTSASRQSSQPGLSATGTSLSSFTPMVPGVHRLSLELAGPEVAVEHFFTVTVGADAGLASDAGTSSDAGVPTDAGTSPDAGTRDDAGTPADAGNDSQRRQLTVGCGCWHAEVEAAWLGVMTLWLTRRRRAS